MPDFYLDDVLANFDQGPLLCAETVLKLIAEAGGRDPAPILGMASGFCSGVSRTKGQCGALTGAIMGIGLFAGGDDPGKNREIVYELTQEMMDRYIDAFGSINCFDLTGCDFHIPEDQKRFREQGVKKSVMNFALLP